MALTEMGFAFASSLTPVYRGRDFSTRPIHKDKVSQIPQARDGQEDEWSCCFFSRKDNGQYKSLLSSFFSAFQLATWESRTSSN